MSNRFFMRFNLQNSVGNFPATARTGAALLGAEEREIGAYLAEFDEIQSRRVERLRQICDEEVRVLRAQRVLFLGDSVTSDNLGYREAVSRAAELQSVDGSVSGGTSATLLQHAEAQLRQHQPSLVSLMIGSNDSVRLGAEAIEQVSVEEYCRNVKAILGWAVRSGARILLWEILPIHEARFEASFGKQGKTQSNRRIREYNAALREVARGFGIETAAHAWLNESEYEACFDSDGIHLSVTGQESFAQRWLIAASRLMERST